MERRCALRFLALALLAAAAPGCGDRKPVPAVGPSSEVNVLAPARLRALADSVAAVLRADVTTVRPEPRFAVTVDALEQHRFYRSRKSVLVVAPEDDPVLREFLGKVTTPRARTEYPGLWRTADPFAAGQVLLVLVGDPAEIVRRLRTGSEGLVREVEGATVDVLLANLYRAGEREKAGREISTRFGWSVRIPREWTVQDRSNDASNFVRVWHDAPVMQMFVSWEGGRVERTPEEWLERRHQLGWVHYDRDEVVGDRSTAEAAPTPSGLPGAVMRGLWENDRWVIGGPFEAWAFYCPEDDRTYLVDLSVYAPDREKLPLLRTLRAVARTFRCGCTGAGPAGDLPRA
jgi:hypothetical protein